MLFKRDKKLCEVYEEGALRYTPVSNWFSKFRSDNFDVNDTPCSVRPVEDETKMSIEVNEDEQQTTREIATRLNFSNFSIVRDRVKWLGVFIVVKKGKKLLSKQSIFRRREQLRLFHPRKDGSGVGKKMGFRCSDTEQAAENLSSSRCGGSQAVCSNTRPAPPSLHENDDFWAKISRRGRAR